MQRDLEEALDQADDIIESVQRHPRRGWPAASEEKSLHEKLYDIYVEECEKEPEVEGLRSNVNLLEKLVMRESLPCLVVSLFPENQGYTLMIKDKNGALLENFEAPYSGEQLLDYLDAEELPPFLLDALEKSPVNVFQQGCVIAEIRDYRQCSKTEPPGYQTRRILLRPMVRTLVSDVESITGDGQWWTQEEKLELESQLILATTEPLCLDPSVAVTCTANKLLYNEQKMIMDSLRQNFMGHEWSFVAPEEQEEEEEETVSTILPDVKTGIACKTKAEIKPGDPYDLKIAEAGKCVDTWKQTPCELAVPSEVDVQKNSEGELSVPCDESEPTFWPDAEVNCNSLFDWKSGCQPWAIRQSIMQSLNDPLLSAEIGPLAEDVPIDSQMCLPEISLSDCSGDFMGGTKTEFGKVEDVFQGSVQSEAECPGKMPQRSSGPECLSQPCPEKKARSSLVPPSGMEMDAKPPAPAATVPSSSGQGVSASNHPSLQAARGRKLPRTAPAPTLVSLAPPALLGVIRIGTLPSAVQPTSSSSESSPNTQGPTNATGPNVLNLLGLGQGAPILMSGSSQVLSCPTGASTSTGTPPSTCLSPRSQMPSVHPRATQSSVQTSVQLILNNTSGQVTVNIPHGSVILHPEPQPLQQPQLQLQQPQSQLQLQLQQPDQVQETQQQPEQVQLKLQLQQPQQQQDQVQLKPHLPQQQQEKVWLQLQLQQPQQEQVQETQQQSEQMQLKLQLQQPQQQQEKLRLQLQLQQPQQQQKQVQIQLQQQKQEQVQLQLQLPQQQQEKVQLQLWLQQPQQEQEQVQETQRQPEQVQLMLQLQQPQQQQDQVQLKLQMPQQQQEKVRLKLQLQQPQQQQDQVRLKLQLQQPLRAPLPPPPRSVSRAPAQGSSIQQWALPAQHTGLLSHAGAVGLQQSQAPVLSQVDSAQQSRGQSLPSKSLPRSASLAPQHQAPVQNVQLRFVPRAVILSRGATQRRQQERTAGQSTGRGRGGPTTTPKS